MFLVDSTFLWRSKLINGCPGGSSCACCQGGWLLPVLSAACRDPIILVHSHSSLSQGQPCTTTTHHPWTCHASATLLHSRLCSACKPAFFFCIAVRWLPSNLSTPFFFSFFHASCIFDKKDTKRKKGCFSLEILET